MPFINDNARAGKLAKTKRNSLLISLDQIQKIESFVYTSFERATWISEGEYIFLLEKRYKVASSTSIGQLNNRIYTQVIYKDKIGYILEKSLRVARNKNQ